MLIANLDLVRIPLGLLPKARPCQDPLIPGFRWRPDNREYWTNRGDAPFDRWWKRLSTQAERILENKLSFFDLQDQFIGDPVDWHRDFSSSKSSPKLLSILIDYRDFDAVGDCKLVWEPNRHHQLVVLARAWHATGDRRFAAKVVDLLGYWIDANPFGYGMNWKSPLEIAIRLINWVWAVDLIQDADELDIVHLQKLLQTTYLSVWETQRKFSRGSSANNHAIGEAAGVFIACCYFSSMPNANKWRKSAQDVLEREILQQTFADGCTREHAFGYEIFVIQFLTLSLLAGERAGVPFSAEYRRRLQQMYKFMADICADTGRPPDFGDADDGYVLDLGERPSDSRHLLTVGARIFDDCSIDCAHDSETAFWLLGSIAPQTTRVKATRPSRAYMDSGYFVLRSARDNETSPEAVRVFFDCAELGFGPIAAHGHADCLSFSLAVDGLEIIVDPGTFDYFTYPGWRRYFRSTLAHNTVCIDDVCQSESLGPFLWGRRANARITEWIDTETLTRVSGEHDGYKRLSDAVIHRRSLTLQKGVDRVEILDTIISGQPHDAKVCFHVTPESTIRTLVGGGVLIEHRGVELHISSSHGSLQAHSADDSDYLGWISTGYHHRKAGHFIGLETRINGSAEIATRIDIIRRRN